MISPKLRILCVLYGAMPLFFMGNSSKNPAHELFLCRAETTKTEPWSFFTLELCFFSASGSGDAVFGLPHSDFTSLQLDPRNKSKNERSCGLVL